jgi:hypothetical protein
MKSPYNPEIQEFLDLCLDCHRICLKTASYCLDRCEGIDIKHFLSCAEAVNACASDLLLNRSDAYNSCLEASKSCVICAQEASKHAEDLQMQKCMNISQECAEACLQMSVKLQRIEKDFVSLEA